VRDPKYGNVHKQRRTFNEAGHAHELTFTCHRRLPLLSKDRTRNWFIESLDQARRNWEFDLWAYVVMPEHAHVLILPRRDDYDIASILKSIKQPVARRAANYLREHAPQWLEKLKVVRPTGRTELRFWQQGGGYDRNIIESKTAWHSVEYIHLNPVRRGLANHPTEWTWSSARAYAGLDGVLLDVERPPDP
jgi:putative transposase